MYSRDYCIYNLRIAEVEQLAFAEFAKGAESLKNGSLMEAEGEDAAGMPLILELIQTDQPRIGTDQIDPDRSNRSVGSISLTPTDQSRPQVKP